MVIGSMVMVFLRSCGLTEPRGEKRLHPVDLGLLVGIHVRRKTVEVGVLCGARAGEEIGHHDDGAAVVVDHPLEEEAVELVAAGGRQLRHLLRREHARHVDMLVAMVLVMLMLRVIPGVIPCLRHSSPR
jgi:hypothetical protein